MNFTPTTASWVVLGLLASALAGCLGGSTSPTEEADPAASADPGLENTLQGWVHDADLVPIGGATVTVVGPDQTRVTNADGAYRFVNLPAGDHLVAGTATGFLAATQQAAIRDGFSSVLNFTLELAPSAKPRDELATFRGQLSCQVFLGEDPEAGSRTECGEIDPSHDAMHEFAVGPQAARVIIEPYWAPATAAAEALTLRVETVGLGSRDVVFANHWGQSGSLRTVLGQDNLAKYYPNGGLVRVTLSAGGSLSDGAVPADAGVALFQQFEVDFTIFYVEPGPDGYTSRAA